MPSQQRAPSLSYESIVGLLAAPVKVSTWNGTFQRAASVYALPGRRGTSYELSVEHTHPFMMEFVKEGGHFEVNLFRRMGSVLQPVPIPPELQDKVLVMRSDATLTDTEARAARDAMRAAITNTYEELGFHEAPGQ